MSLLHRRRNIPAETARPQDPAGAPARSPYGRASRTLTGIVWFGICAATAALVVLIVFMPRNTRSVEVTFLWMHPSVPLALALLVAGVGVALVAFAFGEAWLGQLRHLAGRRQ